MKYKTYVITYLYYLIVHSMRITYSFLKPNFKEAFNLGNTYMANIDALVYLGLGVGFFCFFFLTEQGKIMKYFLRYSLTSIFFYLVIPISALTGFGITYNQNGISQSSESIKIIFMISMFLYGFFQFIMWPTALVLINEHYNNEQNGGSLGFWGSSGDMGNILGYLSTSVLVVNIGVSWTVPLLIISGILIISILCVFFFLRRTKEQKEQQRSFNIQFLGQQEIQNEETQISCTKFIDFTKRVCKSGRYVLFICITCLFKSILYGFLLWMPTYIKNIGLQQLQAIASILFSVGTILGSFLIGTLYEQKIAEGQQGSHLKKFVLFYVSLIDLGSLFLITLIGDNTILFIIFSTISGFSIGGVYNCLTLNETMHLTAKNPPEIIMTVVLTMGPASITTGVIEFLISLILSDQEGTSSEIYGNIFKVLLGVGIMATILLFIRSYIFHESRENLIKVPESQDQKYS